MHVAWLFAVVVQHKTALALPAASAMYKLASMARHDSSILDIIAGQVMRLPCRMLNWSGLVISLVTRLHNQHAASTPRN